MRVGIIALADSAKPRPADLLRAEYLAAAARQARHEARCVAVKLPIAPADFQAKLADLHAHILFYYVSHHHGAETAELTDAAYQQNPNRPQFLAGPWATSDPERAIKAGPINGLLRGECDLTLPKLLASLSDKEELEKVPGLWLRHGRGKHHRSDMGSPPEPDQLPLPDFNGFDWPSLGALLRGTLPAEASRGCHAAPKIGIFSAQRRAYAATPDARYHRVRPVDDVLRDIQAARLRFDPLKLQFVDELFPHDPKWLDEFATRLPAETSLPFSAYLCAELHGQRETMKKLAQAGMTDAHLFIVCGDRDIRGRLIPFNLDDDAIFALVRRAHSYKIRVTAHVVVGLPFETREHMMKTEQFLRSNDFDAISPRVFEPTPGSSLYAKLVERGLVDPEGGGLSETKTQALGATKMDIGYYADRIYRFHLEKQAADYEGARGYFAFIEHVPQANHRARNIEQVAIQRRGGDPAFTQAAPAESAFTATVKPGTIVTGAVEMLAGAPDQTRSGGQVQVEISFLSDDGGDTKLFSARLGGPKDPGRVAFRAKTRLAEPTNGLIVFTTRDAGGGEGLAVAWVDPALEMAPSEGSSDLMAKPQSGFNLRAIVESVAPGEAREEPSYVVANNDPRPTPAPLPPPSTPLPAPGAPAGGANGGGRDAVRTAPSGRVYAEGRFDARRLEHPVPPAGLPERRGGRELSPAIERELRPPDFAPIAPGSNGELERLRDRVEEWERFAGNKLMALRDLHAQAARLRRDNERLRAKAKKLRERLGERDEQEEAGVLEGQEEGED